MFSYTAKRIWKPTLCVLLCILFETHGRPQNNIALVTTTIPTIVKNDTTSPSEIKIEIVEKNEPQPPPVITKVHVRSDIQYRYAKTVVETSIKNPSTSKSQEVFFNMVLPDTAFTSNFTIKLAGDDKLYVADVAKKEDAQKTYDEAVQQGQSVGLVNKDTRDANQLSVSVNLEPAGKLTFTLTYEELLKRVNSKYEYILHIQPGQIIKDYRADIYINESLPLKSIHVPELKTNPNEITSQLESNSIATVERDIDGVPNRAHVVFKPDIQYQKLSAKSLEKDEDDGMFGQFIVQYDVDLSSTGGNEIQVLDGYFVHYFAPENLQTLPRHVIFVVDVSGSMSGTKLKQTKDAMVTILDDMTEQDYFDIITFSTDVSYWRSEENQKQLIEKLIAPTTTTTEAPTTTTENNSTDTTQPYVQVQQQQQVQNSPKRPPILHRPLLSKTPFGPGFEETNTDVMSLVHSATDKNKQDALLHVLELDAQGSTNINEALLKALSLVEDVKKLERLPENVRPTIVFLTDGEPTVGITSISEIKKNVNDKNKELNVPIFGLAFGVDPDFSLVKDIATESGAFARRIYETSDAAIQLEDFHSRIASPLLYDVQFKYVGGSFSDQTRLNVSKTFYKGGEYVIAGKITYDISAEEQAHPKILIEASQYLPTKYEKEILPCFLRGENNSSSAISESSTVPSLILNRPSLCIPTPKPTITRTDAENFIERLWAFLTIQNLLDDTTEKEEPSYFDLSPITTTISTIEIAEELNKTTLIPEKSDREKAIDIALKYNFVTDVTSLVVKKPNEDKNISSFNNNSNLESNKDVLSSQLDSTQSLQSIIPQADYSTSYVNQKQVNYGFSQKVFIPKGGNNYGARRPSPFLSSACPTCSMGSVFSPSSGSLSLNRTPPPPRRQQISHNRIIGGWPGGMLITTTGAYLATAAATTTVTIGTTTRRPALQPIELLDLGNEEEYQITTQQIETEKDPAFLDCKLSLYSKTYLRGDNFTLDKQNSESNDTLLIEDLSEVKFDNKQTSLLVGGGANGTTRCCWGVYSEPKFNGKFLHFRFNPYNKGKYKSAQDMGKLFRAASSIQLLNEDCDEPYYS